jgi:hypothetical protein
MTTAEAAAVIHDGETKNRSDALDGGPGLLLLVIAGPRVPHTFGYPRLPVFIPLCL